MKHHGLRGGSRTVGRWLAMALGRMAIVAAVVGAIGGVAPTAHADGRPAYRVDDPALVYLGNPRLFKKPCHVTTDRVYRSIPEYREILDKNLTEKDVRYHFLLKKASEKFSAAVKEVARERGYDLVASAGAVISNAADAPAVPDGTDATILKLPS